MKQSTQQHNRSCLTWAAVILSVITASSLRGDTDKKADQADAPRVTGTFAGDGVKMVIAWTDNRPRGQIIRNDQSFTFVGKQKGFTITGTFLNGDVAIDFSAKLEGDTLAFSSGSLIYKLKRQIDVQSILGTYKSGSNAMVIEADNDNFKGDIILAGKRLPMTATKKENSLVGQFNKDNKRHPFSAKFDGEMLTLSVGIEQIKMRRETGSTLSVETKRKVRETVLAKSAVVIDSTILVDPTNSKIAYTTRRPDRFAFQVWINGKAMQSDIHPVVGSRFSPDGSRFVHLMKKDEKYFVVIDDKPGDPYDEVIVHLDIFSTDSKRSIYAARTGKVWRIVVDGKPGPAFDNLSKLFGFSADGRRYAYIGERNGKWHMVIDGVISPAYEEVLLSWQTFSMDSKHVHYAAARDGKQVPIVDGKEVGSHDAIADMRFSPDGNRFAYVGLDGSSSRVIIDGVASRTYDHVRSLEFSPDGKKLAFPVRVKGKTAMIINGKQVGNPFDELSDPVFSSDSKRVLYLAQSKGEQFVVIDGEPSAAYDEIRVAIFSPDGKRVGFIARKGDLWFVVVDGKPSYPFTSEPHHLIFSPNSKHVVHVAKRDGHTYLVLNGTEGKPIWPMLPSSAIVFDDATRFHTVVRRADEFIRLDVELLD